MADTSKFLVKNEEEILEKLRDLHHHKNPTNWVLLGYVSKAEVGLLGLGTGGLSEFISNLKPDQVMYGVLELTVTGDEYNPIKFVLVTWIGPKVPPGLLKARASAHRDDLFELVKKSVPIACQHQAESLDDLTYEQLAQAISRYRPKYGQASTATEKRQDMSRSHSKGGHTSAFSVVDPERCETALRSVYEGKADWAILAYVQGKKDEVELIGTGSGGVEAVKKLFPSDRVFYALVSIKFQTTASSVEALTKFILVTMIGPNVSPLQKARSSAQRRDVTDFILTVAPVNAHYQPNDPTELSEAVLTKMFSE